MDNNSTNINKTNNHLSPKEKFKQWRSTILLISTKQTITSHLNKRLNSAGQQLYQYQQNKQSSLT
jgi:hypothetical protein